MLTTSEYMEAIDSVRVNRNQANVCEVLAVLIGGCFANVRCNFSTICSSGCGLGLFSKKAIACNETLHDCSFQLDSTFSTSSSPRLLDGHTESYTMHSDGQLHFVGGPASLLNGVCERCANVAQEFDCHPVHTIGFMTTCKVIPPQTQLYTHYGSTYRTDLFCICYRPLSDAATQTQQHIPLCEDHIIESFNPLNTTDYVHSLESEARKYRRLNRILMSKLHIQ